MRCSFRGFLRVLLAAFAISLPLPAQAQNRAEIDKARAAYLARNYDEAEARLRWLLDPASGAKELWLLSQGRMYLGAVLFARGVHDEAVAFFEKLIADDPSFEPDPLSFPPDVINSFFDVRGRLEERRRQITLDASRLEAQQRALAEEQRRRQQAWLERITRMAEEETIVERRSRWVAFAPFGVGQFQNGKSALGWTFLSAEAACVVGSAVTVPMFAYARARAESEVHAGDLQRQADGYQARANTLQWVNLGFVAAFAAIAVVGVVEANASFVPEKVHVRSRRIPPVAALLPLVTTGLVF